MVRQTKGSLDFNFCNRYIGYIVIETSFKYGVYFINGNSAIFGFTRAELIIYLQIKQRGYSARFIHVDL